MITNDQIREFAAANPKLVTRRESTTYPGLYVVKYTRKVFYESLWNDILEECRGLVVDKDWNTVVRPFKKIYNRGENGTDFELHQKVTAVRKVNGFMAGLTQYKDWGVVSTTGSLDSDFVNLARGYLEHFPASGMPDGYTWLFEICDRSDPHIIPEKPGAYLIGARNIITGEMLSEKELDSYQTHFMRPHYYSGLKFSTVLDLAKNCQHEGFVVHGPGKSLKIKSPYYLFTKFVARSSVKLEGIMNGDYNKSIDEEFYPLVAALKASEADIKAMDEQQRITFIRNYFENQ